MVECRFADPSREQAWNDWYSGQRLDELLSVPGFRGSQRLRALGRVPAHYLAVHEIDSMDVFASAAYKAIGGGGFLGYQDCITDWVRRFFIGAAALSRVGLDQRLVLTDSGRTAVAASGIDFTWFEEVGGKHTERGLARIDAARAQACLTERQRAFEIYEPAMAWRPGSAGSVS